MLIACSIVAEIGTFIYLLNSIRLRIQYKPENNRKQEIVYTSIMNVL